MNQNIIQLALVVDDYDRALDFYIKKLGFELVSDEKLNDTKRWVVVKPKGDGTCSVLLAQASNDEQHAVIGRQSGGRVFLFLSTDNLDRDLARLRNENVKIIRGPVTEVYGRVLVFEDLYGNKWDLIEPVKK